MPDIDRALLLGALGWPGPAHSEGSCHWSKPGPGPLSRAVYHVSQDAHRVSASLELEGLDADFEPSRRPLLLAEFSSDGLGRLSISRWAKLGADAPLGEHSQREALEAFAQARLAFSRPPELALFGAFDAPTTRGARP
jgi:hypothetical protein